MSITLILACLFCLVLGAVLGFVLARTIHPEEQRRKTLESQLEKARLELKEYQQAVTSHFLETSAKVSDLTQSYRHLHEHLASGAMHLANPDISRQLIEAGYGKLAPPPSNKPGYIEETPEPPKDYAPENGVLREDYGLRDERAKLTGYPGAVDVDFEDDERDPTLKTG